MKAKAVPGWKGKLIRRSALLFWWHPSHQIHRKPRWEATQPASKLLVTHCRWHSCHKGKWTLWQGCLQHSVPLGRRALEKRNTGLSKVIGDLHWSNLCTPRPSRTVWNTNRWVEGVTSDSGLMGLLLLSGYWHMLLGPLSNGPTVAFVITPNGSFSETLQCSLLGPPTPTNSLAQFLLSGFLGSPGTWLVHPWSPG